jgi:acyl-CoA dehydrogenase
VREQFNVPIGKFEGIEELLGRLAATAYVLDGARRLTCAALDQGHRPAVISAILKSQATERMRTSINEAMDIHGGKAIMDGPQNYLGNFCRAIPIGITVEGANVLTRNLIVYGQGAIRCHPYLFEEMMALAEADTKRGLDRFDKVFWSHAEHSLMTMMRALWRSWTGGRLARAPEKGAAARFYRQLSRYAASFAFVSDMALLTLGGALKRKEMLAARLGDILPELYLLSAALRRWQDEGRQEAYFPLLAGCMENGFDTIEARFADVFANFPNRFVALILRLVTQPFGARHHSPADTLTQRCAQILLESSETRDRLTAGIYLGKDDEALARLERAFTLTIENEPVARKLRDARIRDWQEAKKSGLISDIESKRMAAQEEAVAKVLGVDDFAVDALSSKSKEPASHFASPANRAQQSVAAS